MSPARTFISFFLMLPAFCPAQKPELVVPIGHYNSTGGTYISPRGNLVATTGFKEKMIAVWDIRSGKLLATFNDTLVYSFFDTVFFSNDEKKLFTAGGSRMLWDIEGKKLIGNLDDEFDASGLNAKYAFDPQSRTMALSDDVNVSIYDLSSRKIISKFRNDEPGIRSLLFSPDGKYLVCAARNKVTIWHTGTYTRAHLIDAKGAMSFTANSKELVVYNKDSLRFIDIHTGAVSFALPCLLPHSIRTDAATERMLLITGAAPTHALLIDIEKKQKLQEWKNASDARFYPDSNTVILIRPDPAAQTPEFYERVEVWNTISGKMIRTWNIPQEFVISEDGSRITTAASDELSVYNGKTGTLLRSWPRTGHIPLSRAEAFTMDGKKMISMSSYINVWDCETGQIVGSGFMTGNTDDPRGNASLEMDQQETKALLINSGVWQVWDIPNARPLLRSAQPFEGTIKGAISKKGDLAAILYQSEEKAYLEVYDLKQLKKINRFPASTSTAEAIGISPDNSKIIFSYFERKQTEIRSRSNYALIKTIKGVYDGKFSADGKKMITTDEEQGLTYIWDISTGNQFMLVKGQASFDPTSNRIVTSTGKLMDLAKKAPTTSLKDFSEYYKQSLDYVMGSYTELSFSPDGRKIIGNLVSVGSGGSFPSVYVWDALTRELLLATDNSSDFLDFESHSGKKVLKASEGEKAGMLIIDVEKKDTVRLADSRSPRTTGYAIFRDNDRHVYTSSDQTIKKWDATTGELLFTFFQVDSTGYLARIPSGYYSCSPGAAKALHYVKGMQVINFEQLDIQYNRPDKVLEHIHHPDTGMVRAYRNAYLKRVKRAGMDTAYFGANAVIPAADFYGRELIETEQKEESLRVRIIAHDSSYRLNRFHIWINEVPVFGSKGLDLLSRQLQHFDTVVVLALSPGDNKIETAVSNITGMESYRSPLFVKYVAPKERTGTEMLRFIGIGIDQFKDSNYDLRYSAKDIRDLSVQLKKKYGAAMVIDTLFNEQVTIENVRSLKQQLLQTGIRDKVIIAYSGHGLLDKDFDYFLSTYTVNFNNPAENGLPYEELENLLDSIPARNKLMLIDACHSGEVDKEEMIRIETADTSSLKKGIKPVALKPGGSHVGMKNSFELMQNIFVNISKSTGATIISAAAGTQFALERGDLRNGVFTYSILEAMDKHSTMKISQLKKIVGERVEQLTNGLQKPTSRNETLAVDWTLW